MIKGISNGLGIIVNGGNTSLPWIASNDSNSFQGSLRLRGNDIQYYDNGVWNTLSTSYATVNLDASTIEIIEWAKENNAIHFSLPEFVISRKWTDLQKIKDGEIPNYFVPTFDTSELL